MVAGGCVRPGRASLFCKRVVRYGAGSSLSMLTQRLGWGKKEREKKKKKNNPFKRSSETAQKKGL